MSVVVGAGPGLVALILVSGIREGVTLGMASITGPPGDPAPRGHRGQGDKPRTIPTDPTLEQVLDTYQATRTVRFPD